MHLAAFEDILGGVGVLNLCPADKVKYADMLQEGIPSGQARLTSWCCLCRNDVPLSLRASTVCPAAELTDSVIWIKVNRKISILFILN